MVTNKKFNPYLSKKIATPLKNLNYLKNQHPSPVKKNPKPPQSGKIS